MSNDIKFRPDDLLVRLNRKYAEGQDWIIKETIDELMRLQSLAVAQEQAITDPTWDDFMGIAHNFLNHYPASVFDGSGGDSGPVFVSRLRLALTELHR